jgi:predicted anti-sigma-YlaC factor YlaD
MGRLHPETALIPYLRGEVSAAERDAVSRHLDECESCLAAAESYTRALRMLDSRVEDLQVPQWPAYRSELLAKLDAREQARSRWRRPVLGWATLAGASVAVTVIALTLRLHTSPPTVEQLAAPAAMADADIGLLRNYPVIERLDMLENYDVIENLDQVAPRTQPSHATRS